MWYIVKVYQKSKFLSWLYKKSIIAPILQLCAKTLIFFSFKIKALREYLSSIPRYVGFSDSRFSIIRKQKNIYKGKRCFITCTGPSLTISDLESLKNEYVFGMNSISLIHDKTDWIPDFFGIQDDMVFEKIKNSVLSTNNGMVIAPIRYKKKYQTPDNWCYFHMCGNYHIFENEYDKYFCKFSNNCYAKVYDGYSITYTLIEIAAYMGFSEIYLIGADCSYFGERQHFIEHGHDGTPAEKATQRLFVMYEEVKKHAEKRGIKVVNATRGGCLEIFKRESLEDILARKEKNKVDQ